MRYQIAVSFFETASLTICRIIKALEYEAYGATGQDADHPATTDTPPAARPAPKETV